MMSLDRGPCVRVGLYVGMQSSPIYVSDLGSKYESHGSIEATVMMMYILGFENLGFAARVEWHGIAGHP